MRRLTRALVCASSVCAAVVGSDLGCAKHRKVLGGADPWFLIAVAT